MWHLLQQHWESDGEWPFSREEKNAYGEGTQGDRGVWGRATCRGSTACWGPWVLRQDGSRVPDYIWPWSCD